jgi:predicted dehydrogenase
LTSFGFCPEIERKNMSADKSTNVNPPSFPVVTRRQFLRQAAAATATVSALGSWPAFGAEPGEFKRKIKLGVIGCGGRGSWIAKHFQAHGGYEMMAVADYFAEVANPCGDALGVHSARRFSTLSGYKRLLEFGVEAVALETPPYFFPAHAAAAVAAGMHVYMAKPVAVDVPGALAIESAAKTATAKALCFFVDYQMPTDPGNQEVARRIHAPEFGKIAQVQTCGMGSGFSDPAKTSTIESRLQHLIWVNDVAIGCDYIGNYDIHAIDAALWAIGEALGNQTTGELSCRVHGVNGNALLNYWGKATMRSSDDAFSSEVENLYDSGVVRNIASFYLQVTENRFQNDTVRRAVDGVLACVLGREAAARHSRLTMDELIQENKRLELDLTELKS